MLELPAVLPLNLKKVFQIGLEDVAGEREPSQKEIEVAYRGIICPELADTVGLEKGVAGSSQSINEEARTSRALLFRKKPLL